MITPLAPPSQESLMSALEEAQRSHSEALESALAEERERGRGAIQEAAEEERKKTTQLLEELKVSLHMQPVCAVVCP